MPTKRRILELIGKTGAFGIQTFDAVMTPEPMSPVGLDNLDERFPLLTLIEMNTTRKPIRNDALEGFFFGATEREYEMARTLGERYLFAFVVLSTTNDYGRPFGVLLTLEEVQRRTLSARIQYQVNLRSDMTPIGGPGPEWTIVLGDESHLPAMPSSEPDAQTQQRVVDVERPSPCPTAIGR